MVLHEPIEDQVAPHLCFGRRGELAREVGPTVLGYAVRLGIRVDGSLDQGPRGGDAIRLHDLLDQVSPDLGVRFPPRLLLQVLADRFPQGLQGIEIPHLAREGVVELGELLPLHFVQGDPHVAGLPALRLIREVARKPHGRVDGLPGEESHDALLHIGNRLSAPQDELVGLWVTRLASPSPFAGGDGHVHEVLELGLLAGHGSPGRLLRAELLELGDHLVFGDLGDLALERELADPLQLQVGLHLHVELEREGGPGVPFQVVNVRVGDGLQGLLGEGRLPALADHLLQRVLPDVVGELLPHERGGGLALAKARQASAPLVIRGRALFGLAHVLDRHGHRERSSPGLFGGLLDQDGGHATMNLTGAWRQGTGKATTRRTDASGRTGGREQEFLVPPRCLPLCVRASGSCPSRLTGSGGLLLSCDVASPPASYRRCGPR